MMLEASAEHSRTEACGRWFLPGWMLTHTLQLCVFRFVHREPNFREKSQQRQEKVDKVFSHTTEWQTRTREAGGWRVRHNLSHRRNSAKFTVPFKQRRHRDLHLCNCSLASHNTQRKDTQEDLKGKHTCSINCHIHKATAATHGPLYHSHINYTTDFTQVASVGPN